MPYVGNPKWMTQHQEGQQGRGHGLVAGWNNGTIKRRATEPAPPVPPRRMCTRSGTRQNRDAREARNQRRSRTRSRTPTSTRRDTTGNSGSGGVVPADAASDDMSPAPGRSQHSSGGQSSSSFSRQEPGTSAHGQPSNHGLLRTPPRRGSPDRSAERARGSPVNHLQNDNNQMDRQSQILSVGLKKASNGDFGLQVMDGLRGPVISFVSPGSASAHIFRAGDVIMAVNDTQVTDMKTVQDSFEAAGNVVWIEFYRPSGTTQLNL